MKRRAETGAGTLIIFISLLLVAAVAAGVIIQTAGSLQQKALSTGSNSVTEVSTHIQLVSAYATDGIDGTLEQFSGVVKLSPSSDPVKLTDVVVVFATVNSTTQFLYSGNQTYNATEQTFGVTYLQTGPNHRNGLLQRGDITVITIDSGMSLSDSEYIRVTFIPRTGMSAYWEGYLPDVISTTQVHLFPS